MKMDPIFSTDFPDDIFDWSDDRLADFLFPKTSPKPDTPPNPNLIAPVLVDFENFTSILRLGKLLATCVKPKVSRKTFFPKRLQRVRRIVEAHDEFRTFLPWFLYLSTCSKETLQAKGLVSSDCQNCLYRKYEN